MCMPQHEPPRHGGLAPYQARRTPFEPGLPEPRCLRLVKERRDARHIVGMNHRSNPMLALNIGNLDRALRVVAGVALIALAATGRIGAWGYIGIVPLLTGIIAWCPLYRLLGVGTTRR